MLGSINALISLGVTGSYWSYLSVLSIYFILPLKIAKYASIIFFIGVTIASYYSLEPSLFARFVAVLIGICIFTYISNYEIDKNQTKLKNQSITDALTGLLNRSTLSQHLETAIVDYTNQNMPACVCLIDIDHFKSINDSFGHNVGDKVLVQLSRVLKESFSKSVKLFRVGGEEFLVLVPNANLETSYKEIESIRIAVENADILQERAITISAGISSVERVNDWKEWINAADENLYKAKHKGRNQVVVG